MNKYFLDACIWINYLKGISTPQEVIDIIEKKELATSFLILAEIADKFVRENQNPKIALEFIKKRAIIVQLTENIILKAAEIKKEQRKIKPKFGLGDALHFATSQQQNATFVTADNDFSNIPNTLVLN